MYEVYNNASIVQSYLSSFQNRGLAIIVGEFGAEHNGSNVAEEAILQYAQDQGIGYLGWSWSGNGSCCVQLDIVNNWNAASLSTWGNYLINSTNGIKATSKLATNFSGNSSSSAVSSSLRSSSSSVRSSSSAVSSSIASSSLAPSSSSRPSSSSISSSSASSIASGAVCNWYGTRYPVCLTTASGWGWENSQSCVGRTSCAALPAPWGIEGSTAASSTPSSAPISSSSRSSIASSSSSVVVSSSSRSSSSTATTGAVSCTYVVSNSWGTGFTGAIRVTNTGTSATSGWNASWQYAGSNRITSSWNASLSGSNPYTAANIGWNGTIGAGQTVEFGFQGNTNGGSVETPTVNCR